MKNSKNQWKDLTKKLERGVKGSVMMMTTMMKYSKTVKIMNHRDTEKSKASLKDEDQSKENQAKNHSNLDLVNQTSNLDRVRFPEDKVDKVPFQDQNRGQSKELTEGSLG